MAILFAPYFRAADQSNTPIPGAFLSFYATNTSTLQPIWSEFTLSIPLSNPVQADGNGVFPAIWLDDSLPPYKVVLQAPDSVNSSIPGAIIPGPNGTIDPYNAAFDALSLASQFYPLTSSESLANITPLNYQWPSGHLLRYANNTSPGVTDMTAAANAASLAVVPYSLTPTLAPLLNEIIFPAGLVNISGTVYVRKGQRVRGAEGGTYIIANNVGTGPTFKMGWGLINDVPTLDNGGQPVSINDIFMVGGPALGCIDFTNVAGGSVHDVFLSAPALGIAITFSSDINIENLIIDLGLTGIALSGSGNIQGTTLKFFNTNFDMSFGSNTYDCQFVNYHSEYNKFTSILFGDSATGIRNIRFTNWLMTYNEQFASYTGAIQNRSTGTVAYFDNGQIINPPGYAYQYGTGIGSILNFSNVTIDGTASRSLAPAYAQSTLAAAFSSSNETLRLKNCTLMNLPCNGGAYSPIALAGSLASTLEIDGGNYSGNAGASLVNVSNSSTSSVVRISNLRGDSTQPLINAQSTVPMSIRHCHAWYGVTGAAGSSNFVTVPYQFANVYQVTLRANQNSGGSASYRKCASFFVEKNNDFATSAKSFISTATAITGANNTNGAISIVAEFAAVGGTATIASSNSGVIAVSWPNTYTSVSLDIDMLV